MYRSRFLRFAAVALLPTLLLVGIAQAQSPDPTYDMAKDWLSMYATSAAFGSNATTAGYGDMTSNYGPIWTVGQLSSNWLNISGDERTFQNFWTAASGNLTSGGTSNTTPGELVHTGPTSTGTYTVPFQFYAATPGVTNQVNVGLTLPMQVASGNIPFEPTGQSPQDKITNPSGSTDSVSGGNGFMSYTASNAEAGGNAAVRGFSNNALQNSSANDGSGSVRDITGMFYNYSTTSISPASHEEIAPVSQTDALNTFSTFGPWADRWIAPEAGTLTLTTIVTDQNYGNGPSEFAVLSQLHGVTTAPTVMLFGTAGGMSLLSGGGTVTNYGLDNASAPYGAFFTGGTTTSFEYNSSKWVSGTITVAAGESLYFATSGAGQGQQGGGGGHPWGGASDPGTIGATINFTAVPEPSSFALLGVAGIGFGLAAWRRRRSAA